MMMMHTERIGFYVRSKKKNRGSIKTKEYCKTGMWHDGSLNADDDADDDDDNNNTDDDNNTLIIIFIILIRPSHKGICPTAGTVRSYH